MKKLLIHALFFGLIWGFSPTLLHSEENPATEKPLDVCQPSNLLIDPLCLPIDISNYFSEKNIDIVKKQKDIMDALKAATLTWSPHEKEEAEALINQINSNLDFYTKIITTPPKSSEEPYKTLSEYTLAEVIHIYHLTKQSSNSLTVLKETLKKIENTIADTEILRGQLRKEYVKTEPSSQKGILGLKMVFYWTSLLTYHVQKDQETTQIQRENDNLKSLEEILDNAIGNMVGSPQSLDEIALKKQAAENEWKIAQENVQKHNLSLLRNKIENSEAEKYKAQENISLEINEVYAHLNYIYLLIRETLEQHLLSPKMTNLEEANNNLYEWNKLLTNSESKINKWTENTLTQFHRSIEAMSIAEEEAKESQKDTYKELTNLTQNNQVLLLKLFTEINDERFLLSLLQSQIASLKGGSAAFSYQFMTAFYDALEKIQNLSMTPLFILSGITITPLDLCQFLIIILGSMWLSRIIFAALTHFSNHRTGVRKSLIYRIHRLIHYALLTLGFVIALTVIGFDFSSFILVAGALGVGIGFGLQSIANNFISGIIILFESYLKIGDLIELDSGQRGEILEINFRSTTIRTFDGTDLLIPNSQLIDRGVTNWTLADPYRRIHVPFSTAYGTDKDFVAKIITEGAKELPFTIHRPLKPDPIVSLVKFGDSGLEFELIVWVDARAVTGAMTAHSDYLWMIDTILSKNQIEIPFSHMDVRIVSNKNEVPVGALER